MRSSLLALPLACLVSASASAQTEFVNWETPHVSPLALTPDGTRLLAVNTPDDKLEVFDASGAELVHMTALPVGIDPVSVRARTDTEVWVVNHVGDSVSVVDLPSRRVRATLATDDEPCDVVFAGNPERAFVSCSQANTVLVFDPANLDAAPTRIVIDAEDPRAMAVSPTGDRVYVAIFESGNGSTALGGGSTMSGAFPPNVASDAAGPWGGVNPPPNDGGSFEPPQNPVNPTAPRVAMIVKKDGAGNWMDDNGGDWTSLVSGAQAGLSGRPIGWDLPDYDVAVIDTSSLGVSYVTRLMNINMAMDVHPVTGELAVVGTDGINEVRFEPVLNGVFHRVNVALVDLAGATTDVVDLNAHLDYTSPTIAQGQRDVSLGDPRGIAWNEAGTRAYVSGMGSNNLIVIDTGGTRSGLAPTVEVGEGPTGVVVQDSANRVFVLNKFESAISVVDVASELETARVPFHDASPAAIKVGRKHLYDTHKNSGLGLVACASCHVDSRMDRLAWDLGAPDGDMKSVAGQNLAANIPLLDDTFEDFHPMKGPMLTQTLQDIIGKEPHHWRGDRDGIEEFSGAFIGLQGDDTTLTAPEMQEFEDFLATIHFPPNPYRNFDNTLPTNLEMPDHYTTGRFLPAGQPMPNGDAVSGLALYRPFNLLDSGALACSTCHTLPTGIGPDKTLSGLNFVDFPIGPMGERHHALVAQDEVTNVSMKIPHLRNLYERTGFNMTQTSNRAGFGFLHDGTIDSIERFISEPIFDVSNDQEIADLTAFMLAFSGSDLPGGSDFVLALEPPGPASLDAHAAVGRQTTLESLVTALPDQMALIGNMIALADAGDVGLVAWSLAGGEPRGYTYLGAGSWQSDRQAEVVTTGQLQGGADTGSEVTFAVVPAGTELRIGVDRDADGAFDHDEIDAGTNPADGSDVPGGCGVAAPTAPSGLTATPVGDDLVELVWTDASGNETGFVVERAAAGSGSFAVVDLLPADTTAFTDIGLDCETAYDYRVSARNCGGSSASGTVGATTGTCPTLFADVDAISMNDGGTQAFTLEAGAAFANEVYFLLGSATGTTPGLTSGGFNLPLNFDGYFSFTLANPNVAPLSNSLGFLTGSGSGTAGLTFPSGSDPTLAGAVLNHAYGVLDSGSFALLSTSNAVPVKLVL